MKRLDRTAGATRAQVVIGYDARSGVAKIIPNPQAASDFLSRSRGKGTVGIYSRPDAEGAFATVEWLNERAAGYPVPGRLAHLARQPWDNTP